MDFALLTKEIEQKKLLVSSLKNGKKNKFLSRQEIQLQERELTNNKRKREDVKEEEEEEKQSTESIEEERKRQRVLDDLNEYKRKLKKEEEEEETSKITMKDEELLNSISEEKLISQLKTYNEPIQLFGETKIDKIKRLTKIVEQKEMQTKRAEQVRLENEIDFKIVGEDIRDDPDKVYVQLRAYLKYLLQEWELSINVTDEKQQALLLETKRDIVPLLAKLRKKSLEDEIFASLSTTLKYLQDSNYLMSNDSYLKLSIGNACWPIGVINIGIHARSAHSRLTGLEKKSNIMSDEKTRKWLMSLKRLITFAEKKWPN